MINQPTVFILGAGASKTYGFPTGYELFKQVVQNLVKDEKVEVLKELGQKESHIVNFRKALLNSPVSSVDSLLEYRSDFLEIGKMAISQALIPCENEENINSVDRTGSWYHYLYGILEAPFETFGNNNVSFITYNYDRSLEQFLFNALRYKFSKKKDEVSWVLNSIPILHLHGQLGNLDWQAENEARKYNPTSNADAIKLSVKHIKIIHEKSDYSKYDVFKETYRLLNEATKIIFLGFGYNPINIKRLNINFLNGKEIIGTSMGRTQKEKNRIVRLLDNKILLPGHPSQNILDVLRNYVEFE